MVDYDPIDELYPSERNAVLILWADIQRRYGYKFKDTKENLTRLGKEVEERFANELDLVVIVDFSNYVPGPHGDLVASPLIIPVGRINKKSFDFDRAQWETQQGYADGIPGTITESGIWRDPKKQL